MQDAQPGPKAAGPQFPRRDSRVLRALGRGALALAGWRIEGVLPDVPKCVIIVAPHTSNWDFVVGIAALFALELKASYLAKHSLFKGPFGAFVRATGGIPVDRDAAAGAVRSAIELMRERERTFLALAPEGTRTRVESWKSGYYRIAAGAGVPILPVAFDYPRQAVVLMAPFAPSGDYERDEAQLRALFAARMARRPENYVDAK